MNILQLARRPQRALPALFREAADGSKDRKILSGGYPRNSEDGHLQQAKKMPVLSPDGHQAAAKAPAEPRIQQKPLRDQEVERHQVSNAL